MGPGVRGRRLPGGLGGGGLGHGDGAPPHGGRERRRAPGTPGASVDAQPTSAEATCRWKPVLLGAYGIGRSDPGHGQGGAGKSRGPSEISLPVSGDGPQADVAAPAPGWWTPPPPAPRLRPAPPARRPGRTRSRAAMTSAVMDGTLAGRLLAGPDQPAVLLDVPRSQVGRPPGRRPKRPRCRSSWVSRRTTSLSARYWANDRLSRWWATSGGVAAHQVGRHVVGGAEAAGAARRCGPRPARPPGRRARTVDHEHHGVADLVDAPPAGPPGQLGVLARGQELVALAGELGQLLDDHRPGRHVDPERQRLGGEHHLDQARRRSRPRPPP